MLTSPPYGIVVGFNLFEPSSYHEIVDNPGKVVSEAGRAITHPDRMIAESARALAPIANLAKEIASNAVGAVSLIPGIGTGVAAALSAGLAVLEGGSPLEIAIKTAYGAIPIPPGVKVATDIVLDAVLSLVTHGGGLEASGVAAIKAGVLSKVPDFARGIAGQVFDTLAHLVLGALHGKPTLAVTKKPMAPAAIQAVQQKHLIALHLPAAHPTAHLPPHVTPVAPSSKHILALHLAPTMAKTSLPAGLADALRGAMGRRGVHASYELHV